MLVNSAAVARRSSTCLAYRPGRALGRCLFTTPKRAETTKTGTASALRVYRYVVDVHGQLFLHDTVPKNLTSCFKNVDFLDFFFKRIRPNAVSTTASADYARSESISRHDILNPPSTTLPQVWSDVAPFNGTLAPGETRTQEQLYQLALEQGNSEGYEWISPCGPELNLVRCQDTPIVYRELSDHDGGGMLKWAGSLQEPFRPDALVVDPSNGYVYHPSPQQSSRRRSQPSEVQRYGSLSLLGSNLVLSRLAEGLDIDPDAFERGVGGSIEWQGCRYSLGLLRPMV